jgi:predicted NAD-dependent protein-ADP-ribosyltransferase YbiA (DUF1768 family)
MIDINTIPELKNDFYTHVTWNNLTYPSLENALQASKFFSPERHKAFTTISVKQAIAIGSIRKPPVHDWYKQLPAILYDLLMSKFQNENLKKILLSTNDEELRYYNKYHDNILGICTCARCKDNVPQYNLLGKELMIVRSELKENTLTQDVP